MPAARHKILNILGKLLVLGVFLLAIWLLYHKLRAYSLAEIKQSLRQIPLSHLALSLGLMVINYAVLVGYDWLALKAIRKKLSTGRICMVSFVGCVISYNFGALLGGSTVRYRLYSAWGFSALDIVRLVVMLAVTFWVGAMGLAGAIFVFVPLDIPAGLGIEPAHIRPLGLCLLGLCLGYLALCAKVKGRPFRVFGKEFALPTLPIALAQTVVASLDLVVAASCLYALLPQHTGLSFLEFLPNYLLAQVAVVLTHVPGGVGVLEVVIMNLTSGLPSASVFAAILAFRVIYYLLPLMIAAVMLGLYEMYLRRHEADIFMQDATRWFRAWMPTLMTYAVFLAGAVLCMAVVIPASPRFLLTLKPHIPLALIEVAHMLAGISGVTLLLTAHGLELRKKKAWSVTVAAMCLGIVCNLLKGVDWPEALLLLSVLFPLLASRRMFARTAPLWKGTMSVQWIAAIALVISGGMLLGVAIVGVPQDSSVLLRAAYTANGPRILRTLAAEAVFLCLVLAHRYFFAGKRRR